MSMNAVFIQVSADELARIEAVPILAEPLFQSGVGSPLAAFGELSKKMEEPYALRDQSNSPRLWPILIRAFGACLKSVWA